MSLDRRAYLGLIRNIRRGVITRSRILATVERQGQATTAAISRQVHVSYSTVLYHLRNMLRERLVERSSDTKEWRLGPVRQLSLTDFVQPKSKARRRKRRALRRRRPEQDGA